MTWLLRTFLVAAAGLVVLISGWLAIRWGLPHYSFKAQVVAACQGKVNEPVKCLGDSLKSAVWHNIAPALWRIALVLGGGMLLARTLVRFGDGLSSYRW
jgi:hypothetical protein